MSDDMITINTPGGPQRMPLAQAMGMAKCIEELRAKGKRVIWHWNDCRYDDSPCAGCLSVHEDVDRGEWVHEGYVVDSNGDYDWHTDIHHRHED